tara:strand:+ start:4539 stop:5663 length:1125 start_codon:yes stop_codon:yes gene_type:complete
MTVPRLVISPHSWHYKYFTAIRGLWGLNDQPTHMSLCPYCQTMFWLSVITVAVAPFFLLGLLAAGIVKVVAWICEVCFTDHMLQRAEQNFMVRRVTRTLEGVETSPLWTMFAMGIGITVVGVMIASFVMLCVLGVGSLIAVIPQIPGALWWCALQIGYWAFTACGVVGWALHAAWGGIAWFFTNAPLLLLIGKWTGIIVAALASLAIVCYLGYLAANSRLGSRYIQKYYDWLARMRERRERRLATRLERLAQIQQQQEEVVVERNGIRLTLYNIGMVCLFIPKAVWRFFFSRRISFSGGVYKILSPFAVLVALGWAIKHRMCPIVEVIDPEELERQRAEEQQREQEQEQQLAELDAAFEQLVEMPEVQQPQNQG